MFSVFKGIVSARTDESITLEIPSNDLSFGIDALIPRRSEYSSLELNQKIKIYLYSVIREDDEFYVGFLSLSEKTLFTHLLKVSGVGPKAALSILSYFEPIQILENLALRESASFKKVPGIGQKTAEKLCIELSSWAEKTIPNTQKTHATPKAKFRENFEFEAQEAMIQLGFKPPEVQSRIQMALSQNPDHEWTTESLLKEALKTGQKWNQ